MLWSFGGILDDVDSWDIILDVWLVGETLGLVVR